VCGPSKVQEGLIVRHYVDLGVVRSANVQMPFQLAGKH
jgi:hypothetical protein